MKTRAGSLKADAAFEVEPWGAADAVTVCVAVAVTVGAGAVSGVEHAEREREPIAARASTAGRADRVMWLSVA